MEHQDILNALIEKNIVYGITISLITTTYVYAVVFTLRRTRRRRKLQKKSFVETFIRGLSENTIECYEDLINIYSGITNLSTADLENKQGLNKWLRQILAMLISKEIGDFSTDETNAIKNTITEFIKENEKTNPYTDLPDNERNIINDISSYNRLGDKEAVNRKIHELSSVIITRYEQQKKIERLNKWSIPLAVIGVILTVIFGILSII